MKLLAVFGLALAVVAMGMRSRPNPLKRPLLFNLYEAVPDNRRLCSQVLSVVCKNKISLTGHPQVAPLLLRHCLETGTPLLPEIFLEMDVVHVAAFIFMFRVQGYEKAAERLYNAAIEKHFPVKFNAGLHEVPYELYDLLLFWPSIENSDNQFFMLRTVKKYGKRLESDVRVSQKGWLEYAGLAALNLVRIGFSPEVLIAGLIELKKEPLVGIASDSVSDLLQMFSLLTMDEYLGLGKSEKTRLLAFLEMYLKFCWKGFFTVAGSFSKKELEQLQLVFKLEGLCRCKYLASCTIHIFAEHFCSITLAGCPAFLLKKMLDFYLEQLPSVKEKLPSAKEEVLDKKRYFLEALDKAFKMVKEILRDKTAKNEKCLHEELVCSQIESTIKVCVGEINALSMEKPGTKECTGLKLPD